MRIVAFPNGDICPVKTLRAYLDATHEMPARKRTDALFISSDGLHAITGETISKGVLALMSEIGIDTSKFKAHSTRSTAASTLVMEGMPMPEVLKRANWASAETFQRYYKRDFVDSDEKITNIIHSKLLPQRNEVSLSNNDSIEVIQHKCLPQSFHHNFRQKLKIPTITLIGGQHHSSGSQIFQYRREPRHHPNNN